MGVPMFVSTSLTKQLQAAVADLHQVDAGAGLLRFSAIGLACLSLLALAWSTNNEVLFWLSTLAAAPFYAFWFICTHDMVHRTLTGWSWLEAIVPRLMSWPMAWPHGLYAQLHRLHHGWNGVDLRDPERVQWTQQEYQQAHPLVRWGVRYQWALEIFVLGGIGLIVKNFIMAMRLRDVAPAIRQQLWVDGIGIVLVQSVVLLVAVLHGELERYLVLWLALERIIGMIIQTRDHLEHYALWGKAPTHQLTQLYACRNIHTSPFVAWLMGGLSYHAVHHIFPNIPFNQLPEAFRRLQIVLHDHHLPLMSLDQGYIQATCHLGSHPTVIGEPDPADARSRHHMIPV